MGVSVAVAQTRSGLRSAAWNHLRCMMTARRPAKVAAALRVQAFLATGHCRVTKIDHRLFDRLTVTENATIELKKHLEPLK
jgi:hypothetical protein